MLFVKHCCWCCGCCSNVVFLDDFKCCLKVLLVVVVVDVFVFVVAVVVVVVRVVFGCRHY